MKRNEVKSVPRKGPSMPALRSALAYSSVTLGPSVFFLFDDMVWYFGWLLECKELTQGQLLFAFLFFLTT